jgi:hypothetical protein
MTLHADIHLSFTREPAGIDDGVADSFKARARRNSGLDVPASWAMTPLAVDSFGNRISKGFLILGGQALSPQRWIGVVAEHALEDDGTAEVLLAGTVITWTHSPIPAQFSVPTHREFNELPSPVRWRYVRAWSPEPTT